MTITMKDVKKEGFEIVEELVAAWVAAPIDLDGLGDNSLESLDYGNYDTEMDAMDINTYNGETLFSLYKDEVSLLMSVELEEIKEYLEKYCETKKEKNYENF